jgi:50S ribosomal protein L16 3-hydroxylase
MRPSDPLLGGLSPARFLRRHWQKRPLCVRQALPGFRDPVTPAALARLAAREDVDARLVVEKGGGKPWEVSPGPLDPARRRGLPGSHWTLLVDGVDRHLPAVAALGDRFDFIPRWRADDVMVSLAAPRGTVGPHVDAYDVFLVQGRGRRRWQVATRFDPGLRPGLDLRILRRFRAEQEWVLEPGDLLYVPPGVAHYGVALEECLTYSVGFRAPSQREVVAAALQRVVHAAEAERLYADPDLDAERATGRISTTALRRMRGLLDGALARLDDERFARAMGEMLTSGGEPGASPRRRASPRGLARRVDGGAALRRAAATRVAFVPRPGRILIFVNGTTREIPNTLAALAELLTGPRAVPADVLRRVLRNGGAELVSDLVSEGAFSLDAGPSGRGRP